MTGGFFGFDLTRLSWNVDYSMNFHSPLCWFDIPECCYLLLSGLTIFLRVEEEHDEAVFHVTGLSSSKNVSCILYFHLLLPYCLICSPFLQSLPLHRKDLFRGQLRNNSMTHPH